MSCILYFMRQLPPKTTRTETPVPYTTHFRSERAGEGEGRVQYAILVEQIFREQAQLDPLVHRDRCVEVDEVEIALLQRPRKIDRRTRQIAVGDAEARLERRIGEAEVERVRQRPFGGTGKARSLRIAAARRKAVEIGREPV